MLTITLLGSPGIRQNSDTVNIPRRKSRALVYYLAAQTQTTTREHLLGLFWPDLERSAAQQSLRTTLHGLRRSLGDTLVVEGEYLSLSPLVEVDVRTFERQLSPPVDAIDELRAALALYRGDFLSGFALDAAPEFDDWITVQAEHYRRLVMRGYVHLAGLLEAQHAYAQALEALDQTLAFDPLQEDVQRAALRLHYLAGDRAGAIRRYDMLRKLLDDEMAVPPMAETRQLYDAILNDTLDSQPLPASPLPARKLTTPADALPYIGREAELRALHNEFAALPHRLILIEGEAGIGKTRLVAEFTAGANALVLAGSARELEIHLPFQPMIEALRSLLAAPEWPLLRGLVMAQISPVWLREVARLLPELAVGSSAPAGMADEARLWEAISQFLQIIAAQRPLIIFLDDMHWADTSTLALVGYLARQTARAAVMLVITARLPHSHASLTALLQSLARSGQLVRLRLERLSAPDVEQIAHHLSPAFAYPLAEWLDRASEGNPYVLAEMVRYARKHDLLQPSGVVNLNRLTESAALPQTVYSMIQERLAGLSEVAQRMLDAAVAIGREFGPELANQVAGLSEMAGLNALGELQAAGLIHPYGDTLFRFDHHLILQVAYREVGEARHRIMHRRAAEALAGRAGRHVGDTAGRIVFHFTEAGLPERAAPYALSAGRQALQLAAWEEAIRLLELALVPGMPDDERLDVLLALGEARERAGHITQASETLRDALRLAEHLKHTARAREARLALAHTLLPQGRFAEAVALAGQYPAPQDAAGAIGAARAELLVGTALSLEGADLDAAIRHLERGRQYLQSAVENDPGAPIDPILAAHVDFELGSVAAQQGDLARAVALYRSALAGAEQSSALDASFRAILAHNNLAYHLHLLGDPTAADHAQAGLALTQKTGTLGPQAYLYSTAGEIALAAGNLQDAEENFERGLAMAGLTQNRERIAGLTANLGLVARERGDTGLAIHRLSAAMARADALGTRHLAAQIRLWLAPLLPRREARAHLAEARAIAEEGGRRRLLDEIEQLEAWLEAD